MNNCSIVHTSSIGLPLTGISNKILQYDLRGEVGKASFWKVTYWEDKETTAKAVLSDMGLLCIEEGLEGDLRELFRYVLDQEVDISNLILF